jgi:hypothetical protein
MSEIMIGTASGVNLLTRVFFVEERPFRAAIRPQEK